MKNKITIIVIFLALISFISSCSSVRKAEGKRIVQIQSNEKIAGVYEKSTGEKIIKEFKVLIINQTKKDIWLIISEIDDEEQQNNNSSENYEVYVGSLKTATFYMRDGTYFAIINNPDNSSDKITKKFVVSEKPKVVNIITKGKETIDDMYYGLLVFEKNDLEKNTETKK
jgi:hypothetical protein